MKQYIITEKENMVYVADAVRNRTGETDGITISEIIDDINNNIGQEPPVISIDNSNGLITAGAGSKTSTYQLAFQAAKTITPTKASQIAVSSGRYTGGNVTVAAIPNEYIIPSGTLNVSENGQYNVNEYTSVNVDVPSSGGGGDTSVEDSLVTKDIKSYTNNRITSIGIQAFAYCFSLTTVSFPACKTIGVSAFAHCSNLTTISFPACTTIGSQAFYACSSITTANFPACTSVSMSAFYSCSNLTTISFPVCKSISTGTFYYCSNLTTANFPVCSYIGSSAFYSCSNLTTISFPACTTISISAFYNCKSLTTVSFPACTTIGSSAFYSCTKLTSVYLTGSKVVSLARSNAFGLTPMSTSGWFYVPASLLTSYQAATNWAYYSSRFSAI